MDKDTIGLARVQGNKLQMASGQGHHWLIEGPRQQTPDGKWTRTPLAYRGSKATNSRWQVDKDTIGLSRVQGNKLQIASGQGHHWLIEGPRQQTSDSKWTRTPLAYRGFKATNSRWQVDKDTIGLSRVQGNKLQIASGQGHHWLIEGPRQQTSDSKWTRTPLAYRGFKATNSRWQVDKDTIGLSRVQGNKLQIASGQGHHWLIEGPRQQTSDSKWTRTPLAYRGSKATNSR